MKTVTEKNVRVVLNSLRCVYDQVISKSQIMAEGNELTPTKYSGMDELSNDK